MERHAEAGAEQLGLGIKGVKSACAAIEREIAAGTTPGGVLGVMHEGKQWFYSAGYANPKPKQGQPVPASKDTLYDCASLTKVVVTLPLILRLIDEGILTLSTKVSGILPSFGTAGKEELTVGQLLTHTSGLQADMNLHSHGWDREQMWDAVLSAPLAAKQNTEVIYSDLGYLTLGRIIERSLELPLDQAFKRWVSDPLGMRHATLTPSPEEASSYAATEYENTIQDHLCGIVHDEKARALGGVCGHAGLFTTAGDLLQYARMWLEQGAIPATASPEAVGGESRILSRAAAVTATRTHTGRIDGTNRGLGWVLKGDKMDASGDMMGSGCYGHTGFTGTSLWIDPELDLAVVLLTNRVYGGRSSSVAQLRAQVHNALTGAVAW
ncbi:serine hydrolase domain-containing protein [Paenibacillus sp. ISL-20]|uniref:serine hydrolase domain-containing protein n=1 Tax=Paenibacillus sp. ISL-20 TaxID=2819163 RepID=UPI001BE9E3E5|nr:serine hydrolase domain-containing protein [Paenibacillus sp. ISL-20]MBT2760116.1 beta-lactamase family protein [Paenibacillus sp. ISL-20]